MEQIILFIHSIIIRPVFHLTYLTVGLFSVFYLFYRKHKNLFSSDPPPELIHFTPFRRSELASVVPIQTGLFIKNFSQFDLVTNSFSMEAVIWFEFNESLISLKNIENFYIENTTDFDKSEPEIRKENNQIFVKYNIKADFSTRLNQSFYPLINHVLYITLGNENLNTNEAVFQTQESSFCWAPKLNTPSWEIVGKKTESGYDELLFNVGVEQQKISHPRVVYSLELKLSGYRLTALIFIPIFLILNFGIFALVLPSSVNRSILSLAIG